MFDSGLLTLYDLHDISDKGEMPKMALIEVTKAYYSNRTVGYNRLYAAMGANCKVDKIVRIWHESRARTEQIVGFENGEQYKVTAVQHLKDDNNLSVTDLTLERIEELYEKHAVDS